jgi:hypothetical protein
MAITNLRNVEVTRLNRSGHGFGVKESNESNGKTYTTYWTVWAKEDAGLRVGDLVNVSGFLSTKVGDPKQGGDGVERRYVEHSLNSPRIERVGSAPQNAQQPASAPNAAPQPQWDPQGGNGTRAGAQGSWATANAIADADLPF